MFAFKIFQDGISPAGSMNDTVWIGTFQDKCKRENLKSNSKELTNCTAWAIINENMDYLRCDDLSWSGKTKCK